MPISPRPLTNDYRDCKLIRLDANDTKSPLIVAQEGYPPGDITCRMRMFYLQHDGLWIDEIARSTLPDSEAGDVVFENSVEALQALSALAGRPLIRDLPIKDSDVQAYIARMKTVSSPEAALREFLARYRSAKGR